MINKEIGKKGEDLAAEYLVKNGCKIIERNWRCKFAELDIIAMDQNNTILIIEVKSLKISFDKNNVFCPEMHFNAVKKRRVQNAGIYYVNSKKHMLSDKHGFRIDLIAVEIDTDGYQIRHYKNAL